MCLYNFIIQLKSMCLTLKIYWIVGVHEQQRVLAKDSDNCYISIPVDYPMKFQQVARHKGGVSTRKYALYKEYNCCITIAL